MNFKTVLTADDCAIVKTGEAVGPNVHGSLRLARAALADAVDAQVSALKTRRKIVMKIPEAKLPSDETQQKAAE